MITPGFSSSLPCFYLRFSVLSFISVSSFWLFPVSKRVSVKPTQLGLLFCFVFICAHGHVKSRCATATGDFHFRTYIFRCILRSISGTLQVHIRNASSIRFRSASGTLWENDLRRSQGGLGLNACRILGPVAVPDQGYRTKKLRGSDGTID